MNKMITKVSYWCSLLTILHCTTESNAERTFPFLKRSINTKNASVRSINTNKNVFLNHQKEDVTTDCFPFAYNSQIDNQHYQANGEEENDDLDYVTYANVAEYKLEPSDGSSNNNDDASAILSSAATSSPVGIFCNTRRNVSKLMRHCYSVCPGEAYSNLCSTRTTTLTTRRSATAAAVASSPSDTQRMVALTSLRTKLLKRPKSKQQKQEISSEEEDEATATTTEAGGELFEEPSSTTLSGITKPLIPTSIWNSLTGREFYFPSTIRMLLQSGVKVAMTKTSEEFIDWTPADSKTKSLVGDDNDDVDALQRALNEEEQVLVWTGKFKKEGYGSALPLVKTTSIVPFSPREMAELLMDSSRVKTYNKMSLGRKDEVVFQSGIDSKSTDDGAFLLDGGEAKIVRNLTKPPLTKKLMEFVTLMCARPLRSSDGVSTGIMGGTVADDEDEEGTNQNLSYIVMSRAVSGGKWSSGGQAKEEDGSNDDAEMTRSEILLGVNILRSIPNQPHKTEITAVTHVNSPSVPKMLAKKVGVKGAIDFVKDIRSLKLAAN